MHSRMTFERGDLVQIDPDRWSDVPGLEGELGRIDLQLSNGKCRVTLEHDGANVWFYNDELCIVEPACM